MATRTIDILLNLEAEKAPSLKDVAKLLEDMEKDAERLRKKLTEALKSGDKNAEALRRELAGVEQGIREVDAEAKKRILEKSLKAVEAQADRTRNKMEKLANVGRSMALVGAGILAPFIFATKKYVELTGESEEKSRKILELGKRWEESQVRIGRVTAEVILPALEKALDVIDKITAFAEENPGFVKSALGIGASLVVLGGMISATAKIVSTIATIQGLVASTGISIGGGAAAVGGGAAAGGGLTAAGIAAAIWASPLALAIFTAAVLAGTAELTRRFINWSTGTDQTWGDISETIALMAVMSAEGIDLLISFFGGKTNFSTLMADLLNTSDLNMGGYLTETSQKSSAVVSATVKNTGISIYQNILNGLKNLGNSIFNGLIDLGRSIVSGIKGLFPFPSKANGGMVGSGIIRVGEQGREFVMSNRTTKAAENIIGGTLTQQKLLQALSGGGQKRVSYYDSRRFDASVSANDRRMIRNETMFALSEALG